ncbi:MAG TPA: metalloregulator ArsR/SmtB family transcription factor [Candidatus Cybelea sp.]|jgi:DNA-binding transcriptional ArsR family regulator|nr:metalloregulator ArsR/SmtB family transcription factor [Candidatus Cybelea sp.]
MPAATTRHSTDLLFKALADPTRREILALLRQRSRSVNDLAANFYTSRPAISKHLRVLREASLVKDVTSGTSRLCELNAAPLARVDAWLRDYETFWDRSLRRLKAHVEGKR